MYRAAVAAADPILVTRRLLKGLPRPRANTALWIFAAGKASRGMATALVSWLGPDAASRIRGLVADVTAGPPVHAKLEQLTGDHPIPGPGSFAAARRLGELAAQVAPADQVYVLISGGASSLIGAPMYGTSDEDYRATFEELLGSGLEIGAMNARRRQISRWAAGRLAMAVAPASVQPLIISDVESDDPSTIGSGPCTAAHALAHVAGVRLADHDVPVDAATAFAKARGFRVVQGRRLAGETAQCGHDLVGAIVAEAAKTSRPLAMICGGETTVKLTAGSGIGGRCQELALSAARELAHSNATSVTLLVAGTDGRDGPTDAAGAIVDASTWDAMRAAGRDPDADLSHHDSYAALDAAGALLITGHTGTNMMDLAIAIVR